MPRMKSPRRFLTTTHQRQRLVLWALAMLSWIAAVLFAGKEITHRQLRQRYKRVSLESLTRMTIHLIVIRATELGRWPRRKPRFWSRGCDLRVRHLMRSLVGSKLRRALKSKQPEERIEALKYVLHHLDVFARYVARRRLTRLRPIKPTPAPAITLDPLFAYADVAHSNASGAAFIDSS